MNRRNQAGTTVALQQSEGDPSDGVAPNTDGKDLQANGRILSEVRADPPRQKRLCADEQNADLHYVVVTIEDTPSSSHALLFSFPTGDKNLLDRYRHGENLQAEEVVQEASH